METLSLDLVLWVFMVFMAAGAVKGITGMGLPTVAMGLLGMWMPPVAAAALLVVPSLVTNAWQWLQGSDTRAVTRRFATFACGVALGTLPATVLLTRVDATWSAHALGLALTTYALWAWLTKPVVLPAEDERRLSPAIGTMTGIVTGATGVLVMPAVPYLQALGLQRDALIQALGLSFTVSTVGLAIGLSLQGAFGTTQLGLSACAVLPALIGMQIGLRIRHRISAPLFRRGFLLALLLLGLELASRPFR